MKIKAFFILFVILSAVSCVISCNVVPEDIPDEGSGDGRSTDIAETTHLGEDEYYPDFYRKVAREVHEDGWVYTFVREGAKGGRDESRMYKYIFYGFNIRYMYAEKLGGVSTAQANMQGYMVFGTGSDAEARDMKLIEKEILTLERTDEELLAMSPSDYTFEVLDGEMFFRLMHRAILGEPQEEGERLSYWDKPMQAFLTEKEYKDGYKFQIALLHETGLVDELYIDVLYKTGSKRYEYDQLSDLAESGRASAEQAQAFELIESIVKSVKEKDDYMADAELYKDKVIAGIDFSRLYDFLMDIHANDFDLYTQDEPNIELNK